MKKHSGPVTCIAPDLFMVVEWPVVCEVRAYLLARLLPHPLPWGLSCVEGGTVKGAIIVKGEIIEKINC